MNTFDLLTVTEKLLWSLAVVSTVLILILLAMSFFDDEHQKDNANKHHKAWLDAKAILLFFTFFGWSSILAHLWEESLLVVFIYGLPIGIAAALAPGVLSWIKKQATTPDLQRHNFELIEALTSTGEVLQYIPPHVNGKGKVHLNLRNAPYQINAVSRNGELPPGVPVRVVAILDDQTLVVEPLDGRPPHLPMK